MLIPFKKLRQLGVNPTGVLHVGANVGEEAAEYHRNGAKKVVWIEGNPELMDALYANIKGYKDHYSVCAVINDVDGTTKFNVSNNAGQSSSILELGTHKVAHPEVRYSYSFETDCVRIDTLIKQRQIDITGCDFLNIDLQGAELKALRSMGDHLNEFKWAYLEVNKEHLYEGCPLVEEIDEYMAVFGFKRVLTEWTNHGWGDCLMVRQ